MIQRIWSVDFLRGIAMLMMVWFHFLFDLNYLGFVQISLYSGFWGIFQKATISLFLLLVGIGITISRKNRADFEIHIIKRASFLILVALAISGVTYLLFPEYWIYFGIIHMIAVSLLLSIPFSGKKITALVSGLAIISIPYIANIESFGIQIFYWLGFSAAQQSFDFVPIFPWFGLVLIGIFIGNTFIVHLKSLDKFSFTKNRLLNFLGKNSLAIYLLHQPIIFGSLVAINYFIL